MPANRVFWLGAIYRQRNNQDCCPGYFNGIPKKGVCDRSELNPKPMSLRLRNPKRRHRFQEYTNLWWRYPFHRSKSAEADLSCFSPVVSQWIWLDQLTKLCAEPVLSWNWAKIRWQWVKITKNIPPQRHAWPGFMARLSRSFDEKITWYQCCGRKLAAAENAGRDCFGR